MWTIYTPSPGHNTERYTCTYSLHPMFSWEIFPELLCGPFTPFLWVIILRDIHVLTASTPCLAERYFRSFRDLPPMRLFMHLPASKRRSRLCGHFLNFTFKISTKPLDTLASFVLRLFNITIHVCVLHFYDLSTLVSCWSSVYIRRIIYKIFKCVSFWLHSFCG